METKPEKSLDEPDELIEAQAEVRHLRETTLILRKELEAQRYEKDAAVQGAVQLSSDEIIQLKSTATSLRDELENLRFGKEAAVQEAIQRSTDEIQQLKSHAPLHWHLSQVPSIASLLPWQKVRMQLICSCWPHCRHRWRWNQCHWPWHLCQLPWR